MPSYGQEVEPRFPGAQELSPDISGGKAQTLPPLTRNQTPYLKDYPYSVLAQNDVSENPFDRLIEYTPQGFETLEKVSKKKEIMDKIAEEGLGTLDSITVGVGKKLVGVGQSVKQNLMQLGEDIGFVKEGSTKKYTKEIDDYRKRLDEATKEHPIARTIGEFLPVAALGPLGATTLAGRAAVSAATLGIQRELTPLGIGETATERDKDAIKTAAIAASVTTVADKLLGFLSKNPAQAENKAANFLQQVTTKTTKGDSLADAQSTLKTVYEHSKAVNDKQWAVVRSTATETKATVNTSPILESVKSLTQEAEQSGGTQLDTLTSIISTNLKRISLDKADDHSYEFMWGLKQSLNSEVKAAKQAMITGSKSGTEYRQLAVLAESVDDALGKTSNPEVRALFKIASDDMRSYVKPLQDPKIQAAMLDEVAMNKLMAGIWNGSGALSKGGSLSGKVSQGLSGGTQAQNLQFARALLDSHLKKSISKEGEFIPGAFAQEWHKMPDPIKKMFFPGKVEAIDGFMKAMSHYRELPSVGMMASATGGVGFLTWLMGMPPGATGAVVGSALGTMALRKMLNNPKTLNLLKSTARIDAGTSPQIIQHLTASVGRVFNANAINEIKKLDKEFKHDIAQITINPDDDFNPFIRLEDYGR